MLSLDFPKRFSLVNKEKFLENKKLPHFIIDLAFIERKYKLYLF